MTPRQPRWLAPGTIPLGALTLVAGEPGLGKSIYTGAELAARVTRGQTGGTLRGPAHVLIASAEDSPEYTMVPRLIAAGADLDRVDFVTVAVDDVAAGGLVLPDDLDELTAQASHVRARLVIVDPVAAHLNGGIDSHRDASVRQALAPLARLAQDLDLACVGVVHVNKSQARDLFRRVGGSLAFYAAARSVLLIARDPADPDEHSPSRVLVHGKCNVAPLAAARRLDVEARTVDVDGREIDTAGITWRGDAPDITAAAVLATTDETDDDRTERQEASDWLKAQLAAAGGVVSRADVIKAGRAEGFSEATLKRAKKAAGVEHDRLPEFGARTVWRLPTPGDTQSPTQLTDRHSAHSAQRTDPEPSEPSEPSAATQRDLLGEGDR